MEQFLATNPNPVLSVAKDGTVLYSNKAGEPLLHEWGVGVGEKLPSYIVDFVQRVISHNSPEKMEVNVGKRVYLIVFHPLYKEECVNISGFDISDQKEVEGKLRESENKYRNIVETSVEGIWIFNSVSETTYVNEKMAEMLGYKPEEMIGRFIWDFAFEEEKDIFKIKLANRKQGIDEVYEPKLIRKDGSPLWVSVSAKGFFDDADKFAGSVGMFTDITDRKRAEEALRESKARVESIFRSSPVGIGVVVDRMIKDANERLCEMTGYSREELLGESALMLYPTAEEHEHVGQVKYGMIAEHGTGHVETRWQRKDGSVVDILLSSSPIVTGDMSGEITFTALDITERKRAEETLAFERSQLLSIFDGIDDMVYVADPYTYEVLYANKAMKEKFSGEYVGGICYQKFQRRNSPCDFCTNPIILKESNKPYHWEYYNPTVDRYFMIMDRIIKWPDGRDVRFEIAKDITERKRAEEALKKAHDTLEEKITERTAELQEAYNLLKVSEERLTDAQKIAHVGSFDWNIATNEEYWSDELYHIFGLDPQFELNHNTFLNCIHPEDLGYVNNAINEALNGKPYYIDYRIILPDSEERIIYSQGGVIFDEKNTPIRMRGIVQDITERKKAEKALANLETARKKEIHHRIKNNLQVISSLLDLQADKFNDTKVVEAFRESQNRVISMALIHEELYKEKGADTLNFSEYLKTLADTLFQTYKVSSKNIHLNMDLEENAFFDMDIAVPLGIIVNELVSNSLKHAFPDRDKGDIQIKLHSDKNKEYKCKDCKSTNFVLTVSDNGIGIPENLDIEDLDTLGMQLVTSLVDQLDGELELKKE